MQEQPHREPRHRGAVEAFEGSGAIVELLSEHGIVVAPQVAARLGLGLGGDAEAIVEVASALRASQRLGLAALPDPLPLVPAIDAAVGPDGHGLQPWERQALVIAAVCVDDRVDVLLAATGRSMAELVGSRLSRHLLLVAGHFAFADPRARVWAHAHASLAERTAAHQALAEAYLEIGIADQATWHRSLATLEGSSDLVDPLLDIARRADAAGEAEWAHSVAREAVSHAFGEPAVRARCIAGRAALHAGYVEDAERWFDVVLRTGDEASRVAVLGDSLIAVAMLSGDVPDHDLDERLERARSGAIEPSSRRALLHAVLVSAVLLAERGATHRAERRLVEACDLLDGSEHERDEWRAMVDRCALFGQLGIPSDLLAAGRSAIPCSTGSLAVLPDDGFLCGVRDLTRALEQGLAGGAGGAARALGLRREHGELEACAARVERSPLRRAERAVAIALLELWAGEVRRAANGLRQAASDLPIALAFGGLGAALARRVELISTGEIGPWARSLEAVLPQPSVGVRREDLIDRAVGAHLSGRRAEAETLVALADERMRGGFGLHLPGLDAAAEEPAGGGARTGRTDRRTPDARLASELRHRMRCTDRDAFDLESAAVAERAREIVSPYERARTELMLSRVCASFGERARADRHLVAAEHLFGDCGAAGWLRAVEAEREVQARSRSDAAAAPATARPPVGIPSAGPARETARPSPRAGTGSTRPGADAASARAYETGSGRSDSGAWDLAECRDAWSLVLTERELEVAMLVVEGISNRDAAAKLFVSVRTVEVHVGRVFSKLAVHSRVELAVLAHRMRGRMSGTHT
ncbi:DNA-binding CsgD family transcriptional regulator [Agromyces terreus]|uniref:DNA-binding CsgD family transcriptional regulator n=1 Tax=Agromyces terreus TaxID=424795 RepID=A0A9X2GVI9_9MICO|nr:helix-turn-helix transcriptional regulator [Agromyces terreus]MCP2369367.1 DNA-binding CsgD family transcriptional regulator [Agromyces terreus]